SLPGARSLVPSPDWPVLPLMALGALLRVLVQGWLGWVGVAPLVAAILLWGGTARPGLLIAEGGALVGVMTAEGRALSKEKGGGFVARNWLENDGDPSSQERAYQRWPDGMTLGGVRIR